MSEGVSYNEPGHQRDFACQSGKWRNEGYSNLVKLANIRHAMIEMIEKPPVYFKEIILKHFYYQKERILKTCEKWLNLEKKNAQNVLYDSLVEIHNRELAIKYKSNGKLFYEDLKHEINELKEALNKIRFD